MIVASFRTLVQRYPERVLVTFVDVGGGDAAAVTAAALDRASDAGAHWLIGACGLRAGDRALLVHSPGPDFLVAFLGCLKSGIVPVPIAPPHPFNLQNDLATLAAVAGSAGARAILSHSLYAQDRLLGAVAAWAAATRSPLAALPWYRTDTAPRTDAAFAAAERAEDDVALLLYTPGSTSLPRGVTLTHANLRHQLAARRADLGLGDDARVVSWLPHHHGFGLVDGILSVLAGNGAHWQLPALAFAQRPALWFEVMSRVEATHTAAPDSAYALGLGATTAAQRARWDLSSLRVMMSAAEPVHLATMRDFLAAFAASRLQPSAFCAAYGLSEHTVGVTMHGRAQLFADADVLAREQRVVAVADSPAAAALVGCGRPLVGAELRIVSPASSRALGEREVGEVWVHSPSVAAGYWGLAAETEATFGGRLAEDDGERRWLRTGDLGFLHEGELFVTGRLADRMLARGRHIYPDEVERAAHAASSLTRRGQVVAFGVPDGEAVGGGQEQIVVVAELEQGTVSDEDASAAIAAVRQRVLQAVRVPCGPILLVRPGAILRTPDGRIRRQPTRAALLDGSLEQGAWRIDLPVVPTPARGMRAIAESAASGVIGPA